MALATRAPGLYLGAIRPKVKNTRESQLKHFNSVAAAVVISAFTISNLIYVAEAKASATSTVRKVFDGTAAYCPPKTTDAPLVPETAVRANINGQSVEITLNTCDNGTWKLDSSLPVYRYTAPNGDKVELHFDKFRLVVQSTDWSTTSSKAKFISLPDFANQASAAVRLGDLDLAGQTVVDINLMAERTTKTASGHLFVEDVTWGAFRISK